MLKRPWVRYKNVQTGCIIAVKWYFTNSQSVWTHLIEEDSMIDQDRGPVIWTWVGVVWIFSHEVNFKVPPPRTIQYLKLDPPMMWNLKVWPHYPDTDYQNTKLFTSYYISDHRHKIPRCQNYVWKKWKKKVWPRWI